MKNLKRTAAMLAAMTLFTPVISAPTAFFLPASAETAAPEDSLPDWIPQTFDEALEFSNTHGKSFTQDGYVCLVFKEWPDPRNKVRYMIHTDGGALTLVSEETLTHDTSVEYAKNLQFHVAVFKATGAGEASIWSEDTEVETSVPGTKDERNGIHQFSVNEDLTVSETGIYSWLPDCSGEYQALLAEDGGTGSKQRVIVKNGYILFCLDGNEGTSLRWEGTQPSVSAMHYTTADCSPITAMEETGGRYNEIAVFKPLAEGDFHMSFDLTDGTEVHDSASANLYITKDTETILSPKDTLIEIRDADTKKLLDFDSVNAIEAYEKFSLTTDIAYYDESFGQKDILKYEAPIFTPLSNHYIDNEFGSYFGSERFHYSLICHDPCWRSPAACTVKETQNGAHIVQFSVKYDPSGDVNEDGKFSIADAVAVQKWLVNGDTALSEWRYADLLHDGRLDARDLSRLLQKLCGRNISENSAKLSIETVYAGYGIDGQFLGESDFNDEFIVYEGDRFFEKSPCRFQTLPGKQTASAPSFTIDKITDTGVTITLQMDERFGDAIQKEVLFDKPIEGPYTRFAVDDGMAATYILSFSKNSSEEST